MFPVSRYNYCSHNSTSYNYRGDDSSRWNYRSDILPGTIIGAILNRTLFFLSESPFTGAPPPLLYSTFPWNINIPKHTPLAGPLRLLGCAINIPLSASTGPVLGRCWQHRPSKGPVLATITACLWAGWWTTRLWLKSIRNSADSKQKRETPHCLS